MDIQPLRGLKDLGQLAWRQRVVVQVPGTPEKVLELLEVVKAPNPREAWCVRIGPVVTRPMSEKDARRRLLEETAFLLSRE
jgi:hypothetical protein